MADQNEMDKVLSSMMEYVCDKLCRWPNEIVGEEEMSRICHECKMDQHICNILNAHNAARQLQASAETVRNELMEKGDWYDALVESIYGYLRSTDGSVPWHQMALELADLISGIEPEQEGK